MGTCSYVLTGTSKGFYLFDYYHYLLFFQFSFHFPFSNSQPKGMRDTFGSTCHGAGRAMSRAKSRRQLSDKDVMESLEKKGISIRVASPKLVMEEVCFS